MALVKAGLRCLLPAVLLVVAGRTAGAQLRLTVSSTAAGTITINSAVPGQDPTSQSASGTTYSVRAGTAIRQIQARLNAAMPAGTTLTLTMQAPPNATSTPVVLTTTDQVVVSGIPPLTNRSGLTISYTFAATPAAGVIPTTSRTITLTVQ